MILIGISFYLIGVGLNLKNCSFSENFAFCICIFLLKIWFFNLFLMLILNSHQILAMALKNNVYKRITVLFEKKIDQTIFRICLKINIVCIDWAQMLGSKISCSHQKSYFTFHWKIPINSYKLNESQYRTFFLWTYITKQIHQITLWCV